jgi:hypothetical protein
MGVDPPEKRYYLGARGGIASVLPKEKNPKKEPLYQT